MVVSEEEYLHRTHVPAASVGDGERGVVSSKSMVMGGGSDGGERGRVLSLDMCTSRQW